jgi:hypothetical protein
MPSFLTATEEARSAMPYVVTTLHDPAALAATCRAVGLPPPERGRLVLGGLEASGWVVRLGGLHRPVVFELPRGLVAYHPRDNAHAPYGRLARFILRVYDTQAQLRRDSRGRPASRRCRGPRGAVA